MKQFEVWSAFIATKSLFSSSITLCNSWAKCKCTMKVSPRTIYIFDFDFITSIFISRVAQWKRSHHLRPVGMSHPSMLHPVAPIHPRKCTNTASVCHITLKIATSKRRSRAAPKPQSPSCSPSSSSSTCTWR